MKQSILAFLLGIFVAISIAATHQTLTNPLPRVVEVKSFRTMFGLENDIKAYIDQKVREGFQVKSVTMMDDETWSKGIVVMEKY